MLVVSSETVAPGMPVAERLSDSALPLVTAVEMVLVPLLPCTSENALGLAEIEKSLGIGALTVSVTVAVCVAEALTPVTVSGYVPGAAAVTLTVKVALPASARELGSIE